MLIVYLGILLIIITIIRQGKLSPRLGFFTIFMLMAFQSNVEGDFVGYKEAFESSIVFRTADQEPLWQWLNRAFKPLGFLTFNIFICAFEISILYRYCKKYASPKYISLAPILFLFTNSMMLIHMKGIRQCLAIEICMLPFLFDYANIKKPKWLYIFSPLFVAYLIHNSALLAFIPLALYYIQGRWNIFYSNKKKHSQLEFLYPTIVTTIFYIAYFAKKSILYSYIQQIGLWMQASDFRPGGYATLEETNVDFFNVSWLIILYDALIVFFATWYYTRVNGAYKVIAICGIIASFCDMLFFGMGTMMRVGYFFSIFNIALIPNIAEHIEKRFNLLSAKIFIVVCVGYAIKTTWPSFTSMAPELFGNYKFIFWN